MREGEKPFTPEIPQQWQSCTFYLGAIQNEFERATEGGRIADFFSTNFKMRAAYDGEKVTLGNDYKEADLPAINIVIGRMIKNGREVTFS